MSTQLLHGEVLIVNLKSGEVHFRVSPPQGMRDDAVREARVSRPRAVGLADKARCALADRCCAV